MTSKCRVCAELPFDIECPDAPIEVEVGIWGPPGMGRSYPGPAIPASVEDMLSQLLADEFNSGELTRDELELLLINFRKEGNA